MDATATRLPNLTLSGDVTNAVMGTDTFAAKRDVYRRSSIGITRSLADEKDWNEESLERRAEELARRALNRWPWVDQTAPAHKTEKLFNRTPLADRGRPLASRGARASQMVLNVAAALLSRDPTNAQRLSGESIRSNVHLEHFSSL